MRIEIITIFPNFFSGFLESSLLEKAIRQQIISITVTNLRDFTDPPHFHVDDSPYGGGAGMVFKAEPLLRAIEAAKARMPEARVILLSAAGRVFSQGKAEALQQSKDLILICGRYEGVDQRVVDLAVDEEISLGDFVLMGGEVSAMAVVEATVRLVPGVVGNAESTVTESFSNSENRALVEAPHYTKPAEVRGLKVPEVLLSGDHAKISKWRAEQSVSRTRLRKSV